MVVHGKVMGLPQASPFRVVRGTYWSPISGPGPLHVGKPKSPLPWVLKISTGVSIALYLWWVKREKGSSEGTRDPSFLITSPITFSPSPCLHPLEANILLLLRIFLSTSFYGVINKDCPITLNSGWTKSYQKNPRKKSRLYLKILSTTNDFM